MLPGMYDEAVDEVEKERLHSTQFAHHVSCTILDGWQFGSLLDAGSGPDSRLADYVVKKRGASYAACDSGKATIRGSERPFIELLGEDLRCRGIPARLFNADLRRLPPDIGPVDVAHARFVLMHLATLDRRTVIENLLTVATKYVLLLEHNWGSIDTTHDNGVLKRFVEASFALSSSYRIDHFAGETIQSLVPDIVGTAAVKFTHFHREEADYSSVLIQMCRTQAAWALRARQSRLASTFADIADELAVRPTRSALAEIVAALISV
jgi:hypothetical protein